MKAQLRQQLSPFSKVKTIGAPESDGWESGEYMRAHWYVIGHSEQHFKSIGLKANN